MYEQRSNSSRSSIAPHFRWCKWFPATDARNLKPGEVGKRAICFDEDYCPGQIKKACCSGWTPVMALCTSEYHMRETTTA